MFILCFFYKRRDSQGCSPFWCSPGSEGFRGQGWRDAGLGAKWEAVRELRRLGTTELEAMRADKRIGASTQAAVVMALPDEQAGLLSAEAWADILIVAGATVETAAVTATVMRPSPLELERRAP